MKKTVAVAVVTLLVVIGTILSGVGANDKSETGGSLTSLLKPGQQVRLERAHDTGGFQVSILDQEYIDSIKKQQQNDYLIKTVVAVEKEYVRFKSNYGWDENVANHAIHVVRYRVAKADEEAEAK